VTAIRCGARSKRLSSVSSFITRIAFKLLLEPNEYIRWIACGDGVAHFPVRLAFLKRGDAAFRYFFGRAGLGVNEPVGKLPLRRYSLPIMFTSLG
jgi:hypothetical protein